MSSSISKFLFILSSLVFFYFFCYVFFFFLYFSILLLLLLLLFLLFRCYQKILYTTSLYTWTYVAPEFLSLKNYNNNSIDNNNTLPPLTVHTKLLLIPQLKANREKKETQISCPVFSNFFFFFFI